MKKISLVLLTTLFSVNMAISQNNVDALPQNSQDFISEYFSEATVESAEKEEGILSLDESEAYEVHFTNGIKLDFDKEGNITEIDSRNGEMIPGDAIPDAITEYVQNNYSGEHIISWEMDNDEQEVELSDGTDLEFDADGEFIQED